jgi:hypothetical protein
VQVNSHLPRGQDGTAIQCLRPDEDTVQQATIGASQQRITFPSDTDVVEITVTADCRIKFGGSTVVADATSRALLKGTYVYSTDRFMTHVSVIQLTGSDSGFCTAARML